MLINPDETPTLGALRALLEQPHQGSFDEMRTWSGALLQLVERAHQHDEVGFEQEWVPYLKSFFSRRGAPPLSLSFECDEDAQGFALIRDFVAREYLNLVYLRVSSCEEGAERLERYARLCPGIRLVYAQDWGDVGGGDLLCASKHLSLIDSLLFAEVFLEDTEDVELLAEVLGKSALRFLSLEECSLESEGLGVLAGVEAFQTLQGLALRDNRINNEGLKSLLDSPHLVNVTRLDLGGNHMGNALGDEGVITLSNAQRLTRVSYLDLRANEISARGLSALTGSEMLVGLEYLNLSRNKFYADDVHHLYSAKFNASLRYLVLPYLYGEEEKMRAFERSYHVYSSARVIWWDG